MPRDCRVAFVARDLSFPVGLMVSLAIGACKSGHPPPSNEPRQVASAATGSDEPDAPNVSAASLGLHAGDALGPVVIASVLPLARGRFPILIRNDQGQGKLEITLRGEGPLPPATTQQYAVYWERSTTLTPDVLAQATAALADRLRSVEVTTPPPPGLGVYGKIDASTL